MSTHKSHTPRSIAWIGGTSLSRWVHPSLFERSSLERMRAKLLVLLSVLLMMLGPLVAFGYFRNGEVAYGVAFILFGLLGASVLGAIKWLGSTRVSSHLASFALLMATVTGVYALGGAQAMAARWFAIVPVLAAVFGGLRAGGFWLVLSWLVYAGIAFAPSYGVVFPTPSEVASDQVHQVITMTTFMVTTLFLFGIGEWIGMWLLHEQEKTRAELEVALAEAVAASEAKNRFLATMSHELRTPLNAIIGYSELLVEEMELDDEDVYIEDALAIRSSGRHLLSMISDILDTTMLESGRAEVRLEEVELKAFSEELAKTAEALAKELENCFCFEFSEELDEQMILTDPSKLRQILFNLLSNAAKFTKGGEITMRVQRASQDRIRFEVEDTGIGLAAEERGRVWDDFVQIDDSSTREHGGVGLGLALVKRLAVMLEADVELESVQGEGSTFALMLPVQPQGV